jgi:lysophospholipase L1-like esterase
VVETSRLTLQADRVHFDTAGVAGLGAMMAQSLRLLGAR